MPLIEQEERSMDTSLAIRINEEPVESFVVRYP